MTPKVEGSAEANNGVAVPGLPGLRRCLVMGILNVTPDSFSDGGRFLQVQDAVGHGLRLVADGADIIDVGGESTRPGALRVPVAREIDQVVPVVRELAGAGVIVSVDTTRARVAEAALAAGATIVNDVSGGLADPAMARFVAQTDASYVAMHWRAPSDKMMHYAHYRDVVAEVVAELHARLDRLVDAGINADRIMVDPGLGFAKLPEHDWALLAGLESLHTLGRPLLIGASRKSFLGAELARECGVEVPASERDAASAAVAALAALSGVYCVRVHDARSARHAVTVAARWKATPSALADHL